jgi:hypothetical protein
VYIGLVPISPKTRPMEFITPLISMFLLIEGLPDKYVSPLDTGVIQKAFGTKSPAINKYNRWHIFLKMNSQSCISLTISM